MSTYGYWIGIRDAALSPCIRKIGAVKRGRDIGMGDLKTHDHQSGGKLETLRVFDEVEDLIKRLLKLRGSML